jgi:hypothetical protein
LFSCFIYSFELEESGDMFLRNGGLSPGFATQKYMQRLHEERRWEGEKCRQSEREQALAEDEEQRC